MYSTILMFFYIFQCNFAFIGIPAQLHSSRITCVLFVLWALVKGKDNRGLHNNGVLYMKKNIKFFVLLLIYSFILYFIYSRGNGLNILTQVINIFIFGFTVLWAWNRIFNNIEEVMGTLFYVGIMQALIICLCLAFPSISSLLDLTLNASEDRDFIDLQLGREYYAGGIGCIAAPGLIRYSTSLVAAVYLYAKNKNILYFISYLFLGIIGTMIARTGLLMLIVSLLCLILLVAKNKKIISTGLLFVLIGFILINVIDTGKYDSFLQDRFKRYVSLNENKGEEFYSAYFSGETTVIPPLNSTTFWGGGILSGKSGNGYEVNVDGGFLRLYAAIGVIGMVSFYFFNILYMCKSTSGIKRRNEKYTCLLLLVILIIGELKENVFIMGWSIPLYYACVISAYKYQESLLSPSFIKTNK